MTSETDFLPIIVHMENIGSVTIKRLGASGVWESFKLAAIGRLHIETDAFHNTSESFGHSLILQDIGMLVMDSNAFQTPATQMILKKCSNGSMSS